jgi:hypothetical protein
VTTIDLEAAAASRVGEAGLACGNLDELMGCLAPCFARVELRRQARKYVVGLMGDLPRKNCWALAEQAGDQTPDKMQRLLERAAWDAGEAMAAVRAFVVARLGDPASAVLVLDQSGQEKAGEHTAGANRQYLGCAGRVAKLRQALEDSPIGYVVKIPCSFRVTLPTGQKMRADHAARLVAPPPGRPPRPGTAPG